MKKIEAPRKHIASIDSHSYICDLIYLEGPVVSLFRDHQLNWIYLWCDTDAEKSHRWLLFPVSRADLVGYLGKETSLRTLVLNAKQRLIADTSFQDVFEEDGAFKNRTHHRTIKDVTNETDKIIEYLPTQDSIFDEELAPDISLAKEINPTSFDVPIDGQWFFSDLDRFSKVYAQLYAFFYCTKPRFVNNLGGRVKKYLASPWKGGYSRINLFEALKGLIPSLHDLEIKQIRYASPGEIRIEALESVGESVSQSIRLYLKNEESIVKSEKMVNQLLNNQKLRRADLSTRNNNQLPLSKENIDFLIERCKQIGEDLRIEVELSLLNEYSPNVVVSTKVVMAMVARIRRLASFESSGMLDLDRDVAKSS